MNYSRRITGFTLIEIMVVTSVVGLMAAMILYSLHGPTKEAALDSSYASVITAFESARSKAMEGVGNGTDGQSITVSSDGRSIVTETATIPLSPNVTISQAGESIEFQRISGTATSTTFDFSTPVTFTLTDDIGNTRTATVTPEGYVYHE